MRLPRDMSGTPGMIGREKAVGVRGITSGRGRLETGPTQEGVAVRRRGGWKPGRTKDRVPQA